MKAHSLKRSLPILTLTATAILVVQACGSVTTPAPSRLSPTATTSVLAADELHAHMRAGSVLVVDVRTPLEYAAAHITGALNVPLREVPDRAAEISMRADGRTVVLYCRSGRRARIADAALSRHGLEGIRHLNGQLAGWRSSGLPVSSLRPGQ